MRTRSVLVWSLAFIATLVLLGILPLLAQDGPGFTIIQPETNARISGNSLPVAVQFDCDADAPVVRFEIYIDSTELVVGRIRKPIAQGHFRVDGDLDQISMKPGQHLLIVKLFDAKGRASQQQLRVFLESPNYARETNPPKVRVTSPVNGQVITGKTDIKVDATDDTGVKYVQIFINDKMRLYTTEAPYVMPSWYPLEAKAGSIFVIRASAADFFDNIGDSLPVTVRLASQLTTIDQRMWRLTEEPRPNPGKSADADLLFTGDSVSMTLPRELRTLATTGDPRQTLLTDTGTLYAMAPAGKSLPGSGDTAIGGVVKNGSVQQLTVMMPTGAQRPSLATAPQGASHGDLLVFDPRRAPGKAGIAADTLVGDLPVLTAKMLPVMQAGDTDFTKARAVCIVPVTLTNSSASRPAVGGAPYYAPQAGALAAPTANTPAQQRFQPDTALVALVPVTGEKLAPRMTGKHETSGARATATAVGTQPSAVDSAGRVATAIPSNPAPQTTLNATDVQKATERGDLTVVPVVVALLDSNTKSAPIDTATWVIDSKTGQLVRPPQPLDTLASRPAGTAGLPRLAAGALGVTPLTLATRADGVLLFKLPKVALAGKATPARAGAAPQFDATRVYQQQDVVLQLGDAVLRAPQQTGLAPRAGGDVALRNDAVIGPRAIGPDATAAVTLAGLPGKLTPPVAPRWDNGLAQPTPVVPATPAHGTAGRPQYDVAPDDLLIDIEQTYVVKDKDMTLTRIAALTNTTPDALEKLNPGLGNDNRPLPQNTIVRVPKGTARLYINDEPVTGMPDPYRAKDCTMVPMRGVVEAKGGVVVWVPSTREVNAWADNTYMHVQVGSTAATINNQPYTLAMAPVVREARTMVPLRYLMSALRMQVAYNPKTGTYYLMSQAGE